jgi:hypothetical protein
MSTITGTTIITSTPMITNIITTMGSLTTTAGDRRMPMHPV